MTMPTVVSNSGGPSAGSLVVASAGPSGRGSGSSPSGSSTSSSRPSGPSGPGGDELGPSSDEVKVFQNEGEDDRDKSDSGNLQADLLEEESSLITESEQVRPRSNCQVTGEGVIYPLKANVSECLSAGRKSTTEPFLGDKEQ